MVSLCHPSGPRRGWQFPGPRVPQGSLATVFMGVLSLGCEADLLCSRLSGAGEEREEGSEYSPGVGAEEESERPE